MSDESSIQFLSSRSTNSPLSLYIHLPWCGKKCPYCDFNSHVTSSNLPEKEYIDALQQDIETSLAMVWGRRVQTIFFGGGTPSLFSPAGIDDILSRLRLLFNISPTIEITLEANPDSSDIEKFSDFKKAGINRLSLGVQSYNNDSLKSLGRLHDGDSAHRASRAAIDVFNNVNFDLMHALPQQTIDMAKADVATAIDYKPTHLSLYQLTLEPNTPFYKQPPQHLPSADFAADIATTVNQYVISNGYPQYEISAYAAQNNQCQHNLNYWQFGDYLGIGAGAHGKITTHDTIHRIEKIKNPRLYMEATDKIRSQYRQRGDQAIFDCLLNALRLTDGIDIATVHSRAGRPSTKMQNKINQAIDNGLLYDSLEKLQATAKGLLYLNDILIELLPDTPPPTTQRRVHNIENSSE